MVRHSSERTKGKSKVSHLNKKHGHFKSFKKSKSINVDKRNCYNSRTPQKSTTKITSHKEKPGYHKEPIVKDESSDSESESDAFSELVSSFSKKSKTVPFLSDEDSSSSEDASENHNISMEDVDQDDNLRGEVENVLSGSPRLNLDSDNDINEDELQTSYDVYEVGKEKLSSVCDPFDSHIQYDLDDNLYDAVSSIPQKSEEHMTNWPVLGQLKIVIPKASRTSCLKNQSVRIDDDIIYAKEGDIPRRIEQVDWSKLSVKTQIQQNILRANIKHVDISLSGDEQLTSLQRELFSVMNNYQDLYYPQRTLDNGEEVRFVYCLHSVNHILKTRLKIVHHNARLANKLDIKGDIPEEFRDQGLIRPKVLILVPFRNSALKVVEMMASILLEEGNNNILNKKRFYSEFMSGEIAMPHKNPKPEDYEKTFAGDTDDNFKIGISVTKKSLKLYADFYSADIIIASPLGLRVIVGAEGQADRDFDFLASIELLVLDQAEIILMQNWDHLLHIWDHLHLQPKQSHGTNFARVRPWALSGRARFYRQTLLFSAYNLPQISALFSKKCFNYAGKVYVINPIKTGTICQIILQLPQVFNRIDCSSVSDSIDARFNYFINKVLPQYKEPLMSHTLIYVPSYFDYVRIRNYFKKETVSFVQICEYSKDGKIARARDMFFHSSAHFLLYSERFHFFRRIRLKGIRHIVFYQPPTIPHFYSELCNLMQSDKKVGDVSLSVSVLYTQYDAAQLSAIVGSDRAGKMLASDRAVHMFMTGE